MALFLLGLLPLALGNREGGVSEAENRTLQALPKLSAHSWWNGSFAEGLEAYLSDQMPGRDAILQGSARLLGLFDAATDEERILDTDALKELDEMGGGMVAEPVAETEPAPVPETPALTQGPVGLVIEAQAGSTPGPAATRPPESVATASPAPAATSKAVDPRVADTSIVRKLSLVRADGSLSTLSQFGKNAIENTARALDLYRDAVPADGIVAFTYVPDSQDANRWLLYPDKFSGWTSDVEPTLQANVKEGVYVFSTVEELCPHMQAGELCYFKTDHHWSGLGAFYVQRLMTRTFGTPSAAYEDFAYTVHENFAGSIAKNVRSLAGKRNLVDRLEVPTPLAPARAFVYKNLNQLVKEVRYMEPERAVYAAFLGGTHSPFYVAETGFHTGRNALVICDSFGLAFVVYAAPYYDNVCLADLRETNLFVTGGGASLREYIQYYDIDDVYFIVSRGCGINSAYMQKTVVKYLG
jgi:hypothetical protein